MLKLAAVFTVVFLAELGDKTQLAVLLFSTGKDANPFMVFLAASTALVLSTGLAVMAGSLGSHYLDMIPLKLIAGIGFVAIGLWSLFEHFHSAA